MSPFIIRRCVVLSLALMASSACSITLPAAPEAAEIVAPEQTEFAAFTPRVRPHFATDAQRRGHPELTFASLEGSSKVVVEKGDTLFEIADTHGVGVGVLMSANDLSAVQTIKEGQVLTVPAANAYEVRAGDTLYGIAIQHHINHFALADLNGISAPYIIKPGQVIQLPTKADPLAAPAEVETGGGRTAAAAVRAPDKPAQTPVFHWPLTGHLISRFGPDGATRNDGVNIAAVEGEPVRAAAAGEVVYASDFQGYGHFVLVRHNQEWVSAYGHNRRLRVAVGQQVRQGEIIAEAGSTGAVDTPQLHFEVRQLGRPADPLQHLPMM